MGVSEEKLFVKDGRKIFFSSAILIVRLWKTFSVELSTFLKKQNKSAMLLGS